MKDCPVCGRVGLADDAQECPQCNADLECFELLESLHEEVAESEQSESSLVLRKELEDLRTTLTKNLGNQQAGAWMRNYGIFALFVLVFVALVLFLYRDLTLEEQLNNMILRGEPRGSAVRGELKATELPEINAKMETINQRLVVLNNRLTTLSAARETDVTRRLSAILEDLSKFSERLISLEKGAYDITPERFLSSNENGVSTVSARDEAFLYHEPKKGETLWSIARRYYDSGHFYPVLLEYNPGLGIYFNRSYGRIKVLRNRQRAKQVLNEVMTVRGNATLIRYKVTKGDTWERISKRFYGSTADVAKLLAANPQVVLAPGGRIVVPMP